MVVVTSDHAAMITKGDTLPVLIPRYEMVRVVYKDPIKYSLTSYI